MATLITAYSWPAALERERSVTWQPQWGNNYSPPTIDKTIQVSNTDGGGLWLATFANVTVWSRAQVLAWQEMEVLLMGGLEPVNLPMLLCNQEPTPTSGAIEIRTVGATAARATTIVVNLVNSGALVAGMHFSYNFTAALLGHRMFRIKTVAAVIGQPTQRSLTIWPPLRAAIADAQELRFRLPLCVMKLAAPDVMKLDLDLRRRGAPSANFIEAN